MSDDFPAHTGKRKTRVHLTQAEIQRRRRHGTQALRDVAREAFGPATMKLELEQIEMFPNQKPYLEWRSCGQCPDRWRCYNKGEMCKPQKP